MRSTWPIIFCILLTSCSVSPNRAGCFYVDGEGSAYAVAYHAGGNVQGAHVYIGDKLLPYVEVTCNADKQEVKVK